MPTGQGSTSNAAAVTSPTVHTVFTIEPFDNTKLRWDRWVKRLEGAFSIFNVTSEDSRKQYLLHYMGPEPYDILCDRLAPNEPTSKTYQELVSLMKQYYNPAPLEIAENFRFHQRKQQEGESVQEFLTALQKLAINCNFGTYLDTALRNQFTFGLRSERIQNRLLETKNLTIHIALETAIGMELSAKDAAEIHQKPTISAINSKIQKNRNSAKNTNNNISKNYTNSNTNPRNRNSIPNAIVNKTGYCYRCGSTKHYANKCDKINIICNLCKTKGHMMKMCMKAKRVHNADTNYLETELEKVEDIFENIYLLECEQAIHRDKFFTTLRVDGKLVKFEVDSGAAVTIMSINTFKTLFANRELWNTHLKLITYCGKELQVIGYITCKVEYNTKIYKLNIYIIEGGKNTLIGREWIRQLHLNLWNSNVNSIQNYTSEQLFHNLLSKYSKVFQPNLGRVAGIQVRLKLKEGAQPTYMRARTVPFAIRTKIEQELDDLEKQDIITKVDRSEWATPIVPIVKADGSIRICGDFKITLNPNLQVDDHPVPSIEELFAAMAGGTKFSKIDIKKAFLNIEVHPDDRHLLTLNTHKGLYQCNRLMFGVASAPAIWQREIEKILVGIEGVAVFYDDIRITGPTDEVHLARLEQVLSRLQKYNLRVNRDKSTFFADRINYCGYTIDKEGLHKMQDKIDAITNAKRPEDRTQLQSFLGLVNYYGRFLPNLSAILHPLYNLLQKDVKFIWNNECDRAFCLVKKHICSPNVLAHFNTKLPLVLATDASPYGVGAVLSHKYPDGSERPIQFASQTLTKTQRKYSQIDKEAYSIIFGVKKFYQYLYGRKFTLITDHKPLLQIFNPDKALPSLTTTRMQHYAIYLRAFNFEIKYRRSQLHANADAMSRLPTKSEAPIPEKDAIDLFEINQVENLQTTVSRLASETNKDESLKMLLLGLTTGKTIDRELRWNIPQEEFSLQQGCIFRGHRAVIPKTMKNEILKELHVGHFGVKRMKELARSYCWWNGIDQDIERTGKNCVNCLKIAKNPIKVDTHKWADPSMQFERVHIDYAGPFHNSYYFILVDAYTRWPEVFVTKDITTKTTIRILREIFSRFGNPKVLVSDNGRQFIANEFKEFLRINGITHKLTAPYHPATNGLAERYVQTLKKSIRATNPSNEEEKHKAVHDLLLQYRRTRHSITNKTPSELMFGRQIRSRIDYLLETNKKHSTREYPTRVVKSFLKGDRVMARQYGTTDKWKFGRIQEILGTLHYLIQLDDGRVQKYHVDQIRKIDANIPRITQYESNPRYTDAPKKPNDDVHITTRAHNNETPPKISEQNAAANVLPTNDPPPRRSTRVRKVPDRLIYN
nr:PREDICTED: uncharacterized protein K02A2.6-like [Megachile rotundata]